MAHFNFISDFGKIKLPSQSELDKYSKEGENIILVLDSCVCLDIVNFIKWKDKSKFDKSKIFELIEYAQKHKIKHFSLYALVDRETVELQSEKFIDFKNKIAFAFQIPIKKLKKFDFNFDDYIFNNYSMANNPILNLLIDERVNIFYAGLLKICEISQKGLKVELAEKNVEEFVNWMEHELDVILGYEYTLALSIFGGNSNFRSMLKIGSTKERMLKAAWASAWDLFHAKVSCHRGQLSEIVSQNVYPIFVTNDYNLATLISPEVSSYIRYEHTRLSFVDGEVYSGYSEDFFERLNKRFIELNLNRIKKNTNRTLDTENIKKVIKKLENNLN